MNKEAGKAGTGAPPFFVVSCFPYSIRCCTLASHRGPVPCRFFLPQLSHFAPDGGCRVGETLVADLKPDSAETCDLLERIRRGDRQALDGLLARHRPALRDCLERHP